jgi:hypothetical protein
MSSVQLKELLLPMEALQEAVKPGLLRLESEVNTTCRYPVDDVKEVFALTELPDNRATCSMVSHSGDVHRLMVT